MKQLIRAGLVVLLIAVVAYPAGAWYLGREVEGAIGAPYRQLANLPTLKVVAREFRRGVFSSEQIVRLELLGELSRFIEHTQEQETANAASPSPFKPIQLTINSHIRHGPLPDGRTFAAALVDSELEVDERFKPLLAGVLGERKLLSARTLYRFDGGGESNLTSPPVAFDLSAASPTARGRLSWDGIRATLHFTEDFASYALVGEAPKLEMSVEGTRMLMTGMRFETQSKRILPDEPLLYAGKQAISVALAELDAPGLPNRPIVLKKLSYAVDVPVDGEFIDIVARIAVRDILVGQSNYGPAHYDLSFKHLHGRTVAQLQRALMQAYAEPTAIAQTTNSAEAFAHLAEPALKLLEFDPQISLDRVSFNSPHGEVLIAARARLVDAGPQDFEQPASLLAKLEASAQVTVPEGLLAAQWRGNPGTADAMQRQIAALIEQGYIQREGAMIKSTIAFSGGQLTVNARPFDPRALQGPTGPQPAWPKQPGTNRPLPAR